MADQHKQNIYSLYATMYLNKDLNKQTATENPEKGNKNDVPKRWGLRHNFS